MPATVYLETSFVSYLASRPSRNLVVAAHQRVSHDWWHPRRAQFEVFVSQLVLDEAAAGNPEAARARAELVRDVPFLDITDTALELANELVQRAGLPSRAAADALHIAIAASHGVEYLRTWNCTHIANAVLRPRVERACRQAGFAAPVLCTPDELMGGEADE